MHEEIKIWAVSFDDYKIPNEHLLALWKRARDLRITRLSNGLECPDFTAELLAACWTGSNGLQSELEQKRIDEKRYLPDTAASDCPRCFGLGKENVYDDRTGRILGVKGSCDHRLLEAGEWLYKKRENAME